MSDLISREAVIKAMENNSFMVEVAGSKRKMIDGMMMCVEIADLPTIEAVPVEEVLKVVKEVYHNFSGYDLEHMTKYGNETAERQHQSYSSLMLYEIAMEFDDLIDRLESMKGGAE